MTAAAIVISIAAVLLTLATIGLLIAAAGRQARAMTYIDGGSPDSFREKP